MKKSNAKEKPSDIVTAKAMLSDLKDMNERTVRLLKILNGLNKRGTADCKSNATLARRLASLSKAQKMMIANRSEYIRLEKHIEALDRNFSRLTGRANAISDKCVAVAKNGK